MSIRRNLFRLRSLPHAAMAIAACGATNALAQGNPAAGGTLYVQKTTIMGAQLNCQDCHGFAGTFRVTRFPTATEAQILAAINGAIAANSGGMGVYSVLTPQQRTDIAAHILAAPAPTPPPPFAPLPTPTAAPSSVTFPGTAVGSTSAVSLITLTNTAAANVTLGNPAVNPATGQVGDFRTAAVPANVTGCVNSGILAPGASCSLGIEFRPTISGARNATFNVTFVGNVPARELTFQGTATGSSSGGTAPTTSANAPLNAGAGAVGWLQLLGLFAVFGAALTRRR